MGIIASQPEDTSEHQDTSICADLWPARHVIDQIRLRDREPVVRAILMSYHPDVRGVDGASALWDELQNNETYRKRAGFRADGSDLCSRPTIQRTIQKMADYWELFLECFNKLTDEVKEMDPEFGEEVAVDGTAVWSHCNPNRKTRAFRKSDGCDPETCEVCHRCNGNEKPNQCRCSRSDQDAWWKFTYKSRANKGIEWVYGYGILVVACVRTQRPIGLQVYTPTVGESKLVAPLVDELKDRFPWFDPGVLEGDAGFAHAKLVTEMLDQHIALIAPLPELKEGSLYRGAFTKEGVPTCKDKEPLVYDRTDEETGNYVYRLSDKCNPSGKCLRTKVRKPATGYRLVDLEVWLDPLADPWLYGYPWRRGSEEWQVFYRHRGAIERLFNEWKEVCRLNAHKHRGLARVRLHVVLQALVCQAKNVYDDRIRLAEEQSDGLLVAA
jgi:transposase